MTNARNRIIQAVKANLGNEPWFRGVCVNALKHLSEEYMEENFETLVMVVEDETCMWDVGKAPRN